MAQKVSQSKNIDELKKSKDPIIIFGSGIVGEVMWYACQDAGIPVEGFCDNNLNKTKHPKCGLPVFYLPDLKKSHPNTVFLVSAADLNDVVKQLDQLGYSQWYPASILLRNFDIYQHEYSAPIDFVEYAVSTGLLCHDSCTNPEKLFMRSVDIVITERCSLKCKDCSNLMQYYQNPVNFALDEIMLSMDEFFDVIDEVNECRVIGGEPFMNKEFDLVIERLNKELKVRKIVIYTNGTIIPSKQKLECLKNDKVLLIITDYGELSKNLEGLTGVLDKNRIAYYAQPAKGWTACSDLEKHNRNVEEQKEIFCHCCAKNTATLLNGRLYRCPFAANADHLRAIPDFRGDYIDISQAISEYGDKTKVKQAIRSYLTEKEFLHACDFCNGRSFDASEIQPAIQTKCPLVYKRYD